MATNYLPPFANASGANVIDYATWITLTDQQTGFEQGIARSIRCNFPWAEGAAAAHALGEIVVANTTQDATINATALATNLKASVVQTAVTQTITGAKTFSGAVTVTGTFKSNSLLPRTTNTYALGASNAVWKNIYATTFTGNLTGTATKATGDADGNTISTTYAKLASANTFSGVNTFSGRTVLNGRTDFTVLYVTDGTNAHSAIRNELTASSYGSNVSFGAGGSTFITSGESSTYITEDNGFSAASEHVQLLADSQIYFRPDLNGGWDSSKGAIMSSGVFRPLTNAGMSLGNATYKWNNVYANSFVGDLTGTASQATADASGNNIADTYLSKSGGTMTGVITRNGILAQSGNASGSIAIQNGTSAAGGGGIWMYGASNANAGKVRLQAYDTTHKKYCALDANGDGTLTWVGENVATQNWVTGKGYAVDSTVVHLAGAEVVTGAKSFTEDINRKYKTVSKGDVPSSTQYISLRFIDKDANSLAGLQHRVFPSGGAQVRMFVYKNEASSTDTAELGINYTASGTAHGYAPTTPEGSASNEIVTANYLNSIDDTAVHKTGNEIVSGVKTFTSAPVFDRTGTTPTKGEMVDMIAAKYKTVDGTVINAYPIQYIGGTNSANNTLAFGSSNGATIIGAGEGGKKIYVTNSNVANSESLFLAADDQISAYCGCANDGSGATHVFACSKTSSTFYVPLYAPTAAAGTSTTQVATTAFVGTALGSYLPLAGGTMTGTITSSVQTTIKQSGNTASTQILGGTSANYGAYLRLDGQTGTYKGGFRLAANDSSSGSRVTSLLYGTPAGSLTWGGKELATQEWVTALAQKVYGKTRPTLTVLAGHPTDKTKWIMDGGSSEGITLSHAYTDYDGLIVGYTNDSKSRLCYSYVPVWTFALVMANAKTAGITQVTLPSGGDYPYWEFNPVKSTTTFLSCGDENSGIAVIYGVKWS